MCITKLSSVYKTNPFSCPISLNNDYSVLPLINLLGFGQLRIVYTKKAQKEGIFQSLVL